MNQIQEMDWADERWHGHTGMDSSNDYCVVDEEKANKEQGEEGQEKKTDQEK